MSLLTWTIARKAEQANKRSKQADVLSEFNRRYELVSQLRNPTNVTTDPTEFYERFWSLQLDQFTFWRKGLVDDDVYRFWLKSRHQDWKNDRRLATVSWQEGFNNIMQSWASCEFQPFIDTVHKFGPDIAIEQWSKCRLRTIWRWRIWRWIFYQP